MNDESARNASRLRINACVCSHALHGQFAHTLLARKKKVGYFLNRPRILELELAALISGQTLRNKDYITLHTFQNMIDHGELTKVFDRLKIFHTTATILLASYIKSRKGDVNQIVLSRPITRVLRTSSRLEALNITCLS